MLSIIIFTPILVAIGVALIGDKREGPTYWLSLLSSIFVFGTYFVNGYQL